MDPAGQMDGRGVLLQPGVKMYVAQFKKNMFHGPYIEFRDDGEVFEGSLHENALDGVITKRRLSGTVENL